MSDFLRGSPKFEQGFIKNQLPQSTTTSKTLYHRWFSMPPHPLRERGLVAHT